MYVHIYVPIAADTYVCTYVVCHSA